MFFVAPAVSGELFKPIFLYRQLAEILVMPITRAMKTKVETKVETEQSKIPVRRDLYDWSGDENNESSDEDDSSNHEKPTGS